MPLTVTLTEGVLPRGAEKKAVEQITEAMLKRHGLTGNKVMTPNVTATVHLLPKGSTFSGRKEFAGAWVEWQAMQNTMIANWEVDSVFDLTSGHFPTSSMPKELAKVLLQSASVAPEKRVGFA
jgi:hypothetical protein